MSYKIIITYFKKLIEYFGGVKSENTINVQNERVGLILICLFTWLSQTIYLFAIRLPIDASITGVAFVVTLILLYLYKFAFISASFFNHANVFFCILGLWGVNMDAGMGVNPSMLWFCMIPMLSIIMTGLKGGTYWSCFSAVFSYSSMVLAKKYAYSFNEYNLEQWHMVGSSNMITAPLLFFGMFGYIYYQKEKNISLNQKFADIGKSSSFIMHEIAKPLQRIKNNNGNIEEEFKNIFEIFSISEAIRGNSFKNLDKKSINLNQLIEIVLAKYTDYITHYKINVTIKPFELNIESDQKYLTIVIDNLFRNAIEACGESQNLRYLKVWENDGNIMIENSAGKQVLNQDELFAPLHSSKPGHMGVGLYISKNLISGLGGELVVTSDNANNSFLVSLRV